MHTKTEMVTPDLAKKYLSKNHPRNRRPTQRRIEAFRRILREGGWKSTHQGIAFDIQNRLIDGQKRLMAIIDTGIPARMQVTFDMPEDAFEAIDGNEPRADFQKLYMKGLEIDRSDVALVKGVVNGVNDRSRRLSLQEVEDNFKRLHEAIEFINVYAPKTKCHSQVRAVIVRAFYTCDRARLVEFCNVLIRSEVSSNADGAAVALGRKIASKTWVSNGDRQMLYALTERALINFMEYTPQINIRPVSEEHFPLPWEKDNDGAQQNGAQTQSADSGGRQG